MFSFRTKTPTADTEGASTAVFTLDDIRDIVLAFPRAQNTGLSIEKPSQSVQETTVRQSLQDRVLPTTGQHGSRIGLANDNANNLSNSATDEKDEGRNVEKAERLVHEIDLAQKNKAVAPQLSAAKHGFLRLSDISDCFESRDELEEFLRKGAEINGRRKQFDVFREIAVPSDQLAQMAKRWAQLATKYGVSHVKVSLVLFRKCNHKASGQHFVTRFCRSLSESLARPTRLVTGYPASIGGLGPRRYPLIIVGAPLTLAEVPVIPTRCWPCR